MGKRNCCCFIPIAIDHYLFFYSTLRFKATIYPCPETASERREMGLGVMTRLEELKTVLDQSLNLRKSLLKNAAQNLKTWFCRVRKMKAIYHTMNFFNLEVNQKCLIAECWAPVGELTRIKLALDKGTVCKYL